MSESAEKVTYNEETGIASDLDKIMDEALDKIPDDLREDAGMERSAPKKAAPVKAEKVEQPPDADSEQSDDASEDVKGEAEAESEREPGKPDYALEKALQALRLDQVPSATIEALMRNQEGRAQLLEWGSKAATRQAAASEKIQKQAEELKRAKEPKSEATGKAEAHSPTAEADFTSTLEAFRDYGEDFQKGQGELARAVLKTARESVLAEIQPAAQAVTEIQTLMRDMLGSHLRRESRERFPDLVESKDRYGEVETAFKRLWGDGSAYADAAPSLLGRLEACQADACQLVASKSEGSRKDDSQRKAQRIPAGPARVQPKKALSLDEEIDADFDATAKRWNIAR